MVSTAEIVKGILDFSEEDFFNADQDVLNPRESKLLGVDYFGVAVNAPGEIDTEIREKLPLIMAVRLSGDRDWEVRLPSNCFIAATNMIDGSVHLTKALVDEKRRNTRGGAKKEEPRGSKPPGLAMALAQLIEVDAKERLQIPWESGSWTFGIIHYDWASNTVPVQLKSAEAIVYPSGYPVFPEPNLLGGGASPCYLPLNKTPRPPSHGAAFVHEQSTDPEHPTFNIYASFSLSMRDVFLPGEKINHHYQGTDPRNIAAIVPATVVLLGLDCDRPLQFDWAVPVYGESIETGKPVQGYFAIDLNKNGDIRKLTPGTYFSYVIMDGSIYGPKSFQLL